MGGAPDVITNPFQRSYTSDPATDATAQRLRSKQVVQEIPVYQPSYQFSVPPRHFNRGWIAPSVPTTPCTPNPNYPHPVSAPNINYINKAYSGLVKLSANPLTVTTRESHEVSAPSIMTTYG